MNRMRDTLLDPDAFARWAEVMYTNTPKSASQTDAGRERLRAYHCALGEFVDTFAHTELLTHFVLRWHTKTTSAAARAVFSGVRTNQAADYLRRLAEVDILPADEWTELGPVVDQLSLITKRRNDILHHGARDVEEGGASVSNEAMALTIDRIQSFPISPDILADMTADLRKIHVHFLVRHMGRPALRGSHPELERALSAPWRYKPPELSRAPKTPGAKTGRRRPQR
jgi:hypothetical protein